MGISDASEVFVRVGVSALKPEGTRWVKLNLKFAHVTVGQRGIFGILPDGTVAVHKRKHLYIYIDFYLENYSV